MIILDTNVISEAISAKCAPAVQAWLNRMPQAQLYVTAVNLAELLAGVMVKPEGKKKRQLEEAVMGHIMPLFEGRCLAFDAKAAHSYAVMFATMQSKGRGIGPFDGQIAAIALAHGMAVATRDTGPFADAGVPVINPWTE